MRTNNAKSFARAEVASVQRGQFGLVHFLALTHAEVFNLEALILPFTQRELVKVVTLSGHVELWGVAGEVVRQKGRISVVGGAAVVRNDSSVPSFAARSGGSGVHDPGEVDLHFHVECTCVEKTFKIANVILNYNRS